MSTPTVYDAVHDQATSVRLSQVLALTVSLCLASEDLEVALGLPGCLELGCLEVTELR